MSERDRQFAAAPRPRPVFFAALAVLLLAAPTAAAQRGLGLGVIVGAPSGVSLKLWLDAHASLTASAPG